jgi:uncharacterized protein YjhX (UPF0386 family)
MPARKLSAPAKPAPARAPVKRAAAAAARKQPAKKSAAAPALPAPATVPDDTAKKTHKPRAKLVRDGFTMPESDFALIATLKGRALAAHREAKKSELLRAGLHALMALDGGSLVAALKRLQPLKVGRPKKGH